MLLKQLLRIVVATTARRDKFQMESDHPKENSEMVRVLVSQSRLKNKDLLEPG